MKFIMETKPLFVFFIFIGFFTGTSIHGQDEQQGFWKGWSVNAGGGASLFYGDTDNYRFYRCFKNNSEWRFGYSLMLQKKISPVFTIRGQLFHGQLSGTKRKDTIWFEGDVLETSINLKIDLINLFWGAKDRKFSVYGMGGVGLAHWETELKDHKTNELIRGNGHNTGSGLFGRTVAGILPFGAGVDYNINKRWTLNLEGTLRMVNSDELDANSGGYAYDFYSYNFVGVTYHFIKREKKMPEMPPQELAVEPKPIEPLILPEVQEEPEIVKTEVIDPNRTLDQRLLDAESKTGLYESPWPGVEFRVQVAASKTIDKPEKIASMLSIPGQIDMTYGEGWYRYTVGHFIKYWKAKEYRNIMATRHGVKDAFVVAFRDGQRITLADLVGGVVVSGEDQLLVENKRPIIEKAFSVQLLASRDGSLSIAVIREMFEIEEEVYKEFKDGLYLYTAGNFDNYNDAAKIRNKIKARGITGAFVVGYKNGVRVNDIKEVLD